MAVSGARNFGKGESTVTARLPLMVRPSAPRFLNFGDRFDLPVVVQNQTAGADDRRRRRPRVQRRADAGRGPPGDRSRRRPRGDPLPGRRPSWPAPRASRWAPPPDAGRMRPRSCCRCGRPRPPRPSRPTARSTPAPCASPSRLPRDVVPQFGGLEVTTSSTALQALTDAVLYLSAYPFECAEQLSSRVLAVAALKDVLAAFKAKGLPPPAELTAAVDRDVKLLARLQNDDGGFPFWRRGDPSWPYVSIHVAHALQRAKEKGFAVPAQTLSRARDYLVNVERHMRKRVRPRRAPHDRRLCAPRPGAHGRPRRDAGARPAARGGRGEAVLRSPRLDPAPAVRRSRVAGRDRAGPPPPDQPGDRDRRRRALRGLLRRPGVPDPPFRSPRRRRRPGGADRRAAEERSHSEDRHRPAGPPPRRALGEHAGEHLRSPRPRPLLRHLREDDARFRGPRVAGRRLRGRARLPRPHHRAPPGGRADGAARRAGDDDRPRPREGRKRPSLLSRRPALRAGQPAPRGRRPRLHRGAHLRRRSTIPGTCVATPMAPGGSAPDPAFASASRWWRPPGAITWPWSIRCPPASRP